MGDLQNTVSSLYSGHCGDLELVSSLARVRKSGSLFQSNVCCRGFNYCPFFGGVRYSGVTSRRDLIVLDLRFPFIATFVVVVVVVLFLFLVTCYSFLM